MNKYLKMRFRQQQRFKKLPAKFAFGKEQFENMMKEWNLTTSKEDVAKVHMIVCGCYCLEKDTHLFEEYFEKVGKEFDNFMKNNKNLKEALKYEFANHECGLTYNPQNALSALFLTYTEVVNDKRLSRIFKEAWNEYIQEYEEQNH